LQIRDNFIIIALSCAYLRIWSRTCLDNYLFIHVFFSSLSRRPDKLCSQDPLPVPRSLHWTRPSWLLKNKGSGTTPLSDGCSTASLLSIPSVHAWCSVWTTPCVCRTASVQAAASRDPTSTLSCAARGSWDESPGPGQIGVLSRGWIANERRTCRCPLVRSVVRGTTRV
jgi:hypothetical protein